MGLWDGAGGGIAAGAAGIAGGIISNQMAASSARQAMSFAAGQSATSHQREVADLIHAVPKGI